MHVQSADFRSWNRWVLYSYWLFIAAALLFSQLSFSAVEGWGTIAPGVVAVLSFAALLCLIMETLLKYKTRYIEYVVIAAGFLVAVMVIFGLGAYIPTLYIALGIPILASICYFKFALLLFAGGIAVVGYLILLSTSSLLREQIDVYDLSIVGLMVGGLMLVGWAIIVRGKELQLSLERAVHSEMAAFADTVAIENASKNDFLTGLYNHITYQEYAALLTGPYAERGLPLQLAVLDIDNFKQINDVYGHHIGDMVLKRAAAILQASISAEDVAARYGGEEFVLLLTGKTLEQAAELMEHIRYSLEDTEFSELGYQSVTISIGLAEYRSGMDKDGLFQEADSYLYKAKRHGKNCIASPLGIGGPLQ